jgi:hypothetical protein
VRSLTLFGTNSCDGVTGQSPPEFHAALVEPPSGDPAEEWETALAAYRICIEPETIDDAALAVFLQSRLTGLRTRRCSAFRRSLPPSLRAPVRLRPIARNYGR